jgi:hypothetical protein
MRAQLFRELQREGEARGAEADAEAAERALAARRGEAPGP